MRMHNPFRILQMVGALFAFGGRIGGACREPGTSAH